MKFVTPFNGMTMNIAVSTERSTFLIGVKLLTLLSRLAVLVSFEGKSQIRTIVVRKSTLLILFLCDQMKDSVDFR